MMQMTAVNVSVVPSSLLFASFTTLQSFLPSYNRHLLILIHFLSFFSFSLSFFFIDSASV